MLHKISVIGAGNVGATLVQRLAEAELAKHVVVVDVLEGIPQGKALDILESAPVYGYDTRVTGGNTYDLIENSDIVVITAGIARKPGMSRDDLLATNARIVADVSAQIKKHASEAMVIVVSNPLDAMCHIALQTTGFPSGRVFGMAGVLDSSRYKSFIAEALDVSVDDVQGFVLGGHGDTMVPLPRYTTIAGIPLSQMMPQEKISQIAERAKNGGAEIVAHLKTGSAFYAPSASVLEMIESIAKDKKKILPCAVYLRGEYGIQNLYVGVPVKLGKNGIEQVIEVELTETEAAQLKQSANAVQELVNTMSTLLASA
jgi:malate dehydrogenase